MYEKTLTIKLNEDSPLYQNLSAVAHQEGCSIGFLLDKISVAGLYGLLENNLEFAVKHQYNRLPVQPLSQR